MPNEPHRTHKHDTLGTFIAARRERLGLSQRQLAARAGMHHSLIARLESGEIVVGRSPEHLQAIADALEIDVSELLRLVGIKPGLPEPRVYFRRKLGINAKEADVLARLIEEYQTKQANGTKKEVNHEKASNHQGDASADCPAAVTGTPAATHLRRVAATGARASLAAAGLGRGH